MLHIGFKKPTPEIMKAWGQWFESIQSHVVDMGNIGLNPGREISDAGTRDLPMDLEAITGISIVEAESMEHAERLAQGNPYISSIRVYEIRSK